jgi:hypothetical protein
MVPYIVPAGDAMVPLADIFNHKASVVELGAEYQVHGAQSDDGEGDLGSELEEGGSEEQAGPEEDNEEEEEQARASSSHSSDSEGSARNVAQQTNRGAAAGGGNQQQHAGAQGGQAQGAGRNGSDGALPSVMSAAAAAIYGLTSGAWQIWAVGSSFQLVKLRGLDWGCAAVIATTPP